MNALLHRLKERKLVQWALAYLACAWLLLQVLGELRDAFGWSPGILRSLIVPLTMGLLAVLIFAWYHGEKGQQRVGGVELVLLSALLVMAGGVVWMMGRDTAAGAEAMNRGGAAADQLIAGIPGRRQVIRTSTIRASRTMMIVVVEMVMADWASADSTARA